MARSKSTTTAPAPEATPEAPAQTQPTIDPEITVLRGRLTRDPGELRHTPNGTPVTTIRIAVNHPDESVTFHNVVCWRADRRDRDCALHAERGRLIEATGRTAALGPGSGSDGQERTENELSAYRVQFVRMQPAESPRPHDAPHRRSHRSRERGCVPRLRLVGGPLDGAAREPSGGRHAGSAASSTAAPPHHRETNHEHPSHRTGHGFLAAHHRLQRRSRQRRCIAHQLRHARARPRRRSITKRTILRISFDTSARVNTLLMIPINNRDRTTPVTVPLPP